MKATFSFGDTDSIKATLTVTMTIGEWRELMRQQPLEYPASEFGNRISAMIGKTAVNIAIRDQEAL
jgi:hypothetical protein